MAAATFEVPSGTLRWEPPNELVRESEKTPNWFGNYGRWIISTFYNQPTSSALGTTANLNNFGFVDNVVDNWRYMFCKQENRDFNYVTTNFNNLALSYQTNWGFSRSHVQVHLGDSKSACRSELQMLWLPCHKHSIILGIFQIWDKINY
jgi:hypothetical protein